MAEYFSPFVTGQLPCMDVKSVSLQSQASVVLAIQILQVVADVVVVPKIAVSV